MNTNITVLNGRLTKEPEMATLPDGSMAVKISIAVNGFKKDEVNYFDIKAFKKTAEIINQYCKKGNLIAVTGTLKQERWLDKTTQKTISKVVIIANNIELLTPKSESGNNASNNSANIKNEFASNKPSEDPWVDQTNNDSDIPF